MAANNKANFVPTIKKLNFGRSLLYFFYSFGESGKLIVIDVLLYSAALSLEFLALVILRRKEPDLPRLFKIPGDALTLILICATPMLFVSTVIFAIISDPENDYRQIYAVLAILLSEVFLYILKRKNLRQATEI